MAGKKITKVTAAHTPHKLTWYYGDKARYSALLVGKKIDGASGFGGLVEIRAGAARMLFGDGVGLRFHGPNEPRPPKHQLLVEFEDGSTLSACVQMYGGVGCFPEGKLDNKYYLIAKEKPSPLGDKFDENYFSKLISEPEVQKLSAKAFLATGQRIPGLGNGVLQDILFKALVHPKKKTGAFSDKEKKALFKSVKTVLLDMTRRGGRDTENDLFGNPGGYTTRLSKNTAGKPCPNCGAKIVKEAYLGGSIYFCPRCQKT
jgi:formamidopyrimidine-DNA glycosylase